MWISASFFEPISVSRQTTDHLIGQLAASQINPLYATLPTFVQNYPIIRGRIKLTATESPRNVRFLDDGSRVENRPESADSWSKNPFQLTNSSYTVPRRLFARLSEKAVCAATTPACPRMIRIWICSVMPRSSGLLARHPRRLLQPRAGAAGVAKRKSWVTQCCRGAKEDSIRHT